jgi:hypothetical protein
MKIITKYPIITTDSAAKTNAVYNRTYSAADGTMEVKTKYPIVRTNSQAETMDEYERTYSAIFGDIFSPAGRERRRKRRKERQKRRTENKRTGNTFGDKVKKFAGSNLGQGLLGGVGTLGMGAPTDMGTMPIMDEPPKKGMSTGMIIGIVVGVAALGLGAYFLLRKKGGNATPSATAPSATAPKVTA